jgi:hypothetical protein
VDPGIADPPGAPISQAAIAISGDPAAAIPAIRAASAAAIPEAGAPVRITRILQIAWSDIINFDNKVIQGIGDSLIRC